jgi:hypothetical protein
MRHNIYLSILAAGLFSLTACSDFLSQEPANYISDETVITSESSALSALNGVYHRLGAAAYYGGRYFDAGVNLASDNVTWTGSLNFYYDFDTHQYSAENQLLSYAWYGIYATVNQANQVIEKTNQLATISDDKRKQIIAEATVLRSLAFFDLARTWGNIPIVKEATHSPYQFDGVKQTPASEVYQDVVSDITSVIGDLRQTNDRVHISRSVAEALLARVSLYLEDWSQAEAYATKVIDSGAYALGTIDELIAGKQPQESVFELAFSSSFVNDQSAYWRSPNDGGRHEWGPSKELVQLLANPAVGGDRKAFFTDQSTAQVPDYYVGTLFHRPSNDDNVILIRLAELYLIRAEARAKKASPDLDGALADVNAIRQRSHVEALSSSLSQQEVIQAIEDENRVEFAIEPHRWFDLVRTHRAVAVLGISEHQQLFPIPYSDIEADKDLVQNENY